VRLKKWFAATPFESHPARMRIDTVLRRDWREYREIRLTALKDAPSAFASTWQEEASLTASQWMEQAQRSEDGDTLTIVVAADDAGRWVGLAGRLPAGRPGGRCRADLDVGYPRPPRSTSARNWSAPCWRGPRATEPAASACTASSEKARETALLPGAQPGLARVLSGEAGVSAGPRTRCWLTRYTAGR
jgi:hypothetical protein